MWIVRTLFVLVISAVAAGCGGNKDCKAACDKLSTCQLKSSGFSCDSNCAGPQDACAVCLNARPCAEIKAGACTPDCPGVSFTNN
jgi:hypothetical protein